MKLFKIKKKKSFALVATSDIAFLLLIFLIITANLEYNPDITAPKIVNTIEFLATDNKVILIEITGDGEVFIESKKIDINDFPALLSEFSNEFIYRIYADQTTPFFLIATVLNELQKSNKQKILMMVEKEQ